MKRTQERNVSTLFSSLLATSRIVARAKPPYAYDEQTGLNMIVIGDRRVPVIELAQSSAWLKTKGWTRGED